MTILTATAMHGSLREDINHRPSSSATPLVRAKALSERTEAPCGAGMSVTLPYAGGAGLIQPAGLARPQPGLQPAADVRRWNAPEIQTRVNVSEHCCNLSGDELQDYRAIQPYLEQVIRSGKGQVVRPTPDGPLAKCTATVKGEQVVVTVIQIDNTVFKISNAWVQTGGQTPDEPAIFSLQRSLQASDAVQGARVLSGNTSNTNSQIGAAQINIMLFTALICDALPCYDGDACP